MSSKKKSEKIDFDQAKIIIAQYLKKEYRPYGVTDLVLNLHNMINKSLMVKALDEMVDDKILIVKKYGKLSFYCYSEQKCDENIKPVQIETLLELKDEVKQLENDYNEIQKEILRLNKELTDKELIENEKELLDINRNLQSSIKIQEEINSTVGEDEKRQIKNVETHEVNLINKYKKLKKAHDEISKTLKDVIDDFDKKMETLGVEEIPNLKL